MTEAEIFIKTGNKSPENFVLYKGMRHCLIGRHNILTNAGINIDLAGNQRYNNFKLLLIR